MTDLTPEIREIHYLLNFFNLENIYSFNLTLSFFQVIFVLAIYDFLSFLKVKNKIEFIKAEENKILIFPCKTKHRVCTSTDVDRRYIINFNYF